MRTFFQIMLISREDARGAGKLCVRHELRKNHGAGDSVAGTNSTRFLKTGIAGIAYDECGKCAFVFLFMLQIG